MPGGVTGTAREGLPMPIAIFKRLARQRVVGGGQGEVGQSGESIRSSAQSLAIRVARRQHCQQ